MTNTLDRVGEPRVRRLPSTGMPADRLGRRLTDLRVSVTDRCTFRCVYCMPREIFGRDYAFLPREQLLTFEEIVRVVRAGIRLGVHKVRLTGGEPLLRKGIEELVAMLAGLRTPAGERLDIALTTNGAALAVKAQALKHAGLDRVTVSVDSLDDATFRRMNDVNFPLERVLHGLETAREVGLGPVKVNMVVKRGQNDGDVVSMAEHFRGTGCVLRFIEYMDVGSTNGWRLDDVVPSREIIERVGSVFPIEPVEATTPSETASRWRYVDGAGEIGVISSVTQPFCSACTRARLSTEGRLFTCLFASEGTDLRTLLRGGADDDELEAALAGVWTARADRYSQLRSSSTTGLDAHAKRIEMSYIGG
jgi:cyclic pyranopterin phosphate synthase